MPLHCPVHFHLHITDEICATDHIGARWLRASRRAASSPVADMTRPGPCGPLLLPPNVVHPLEQWDPAPSSIAQEDLWDSLDYWCGFLQHGRRIRCMWISVTRDRTPLFCSDANWLQGGEPKLGWMRQVIVLGSCSVSLYPLTMGYAFVLLHTPCLWLSRLEGWNLE